MFKKGYKVIIIKDGQFDLKQFHLSRLVSSILVCLIPIPFILFYFVVNFFSGNSLSNKNEIISSQNTQINELKIDNEAKSQKLANYEKEIEKKIIDNPLLNKE